MATESRTRGRGGVATTAVAKPRRRAAAQPVTVILGDTRLPDKVKLGGRFEAEHFAVIAELKAALGALGDFEFAYIDDHAKLPSELGAARPPFVFNLCDEGLRNEAQQEMHVPALLEAYGIPYSGAAPACLAVCLDKSIARAVAAELGIAVPQEIHLAHPEAVDAAQLAGRPYPAFVKPALADGSFGIGPESVVATPAAAAEQIRRIGRLLAGLPVLMQEFLPGREWSVTLIGNPGAGLEALPILEADYGALAPALPPIQPYAAKWDRASPYWEGFDFRAARLAADESARLIALSAQLFERLGCRDYARFEFRADAAGTVKLLEVNPNPSWACDSEMAQAAELAGLSYGALLEKILAAARARYPQFARR
jgi:D-alanine-D-alanine ligase